MTAVSRTEPVEQLRPASFDKFRTTPVEWRGPTAPLSSLGLAPDGSDREILGQGASGLLSIFNAAGVLNPADVHTAETVCRIGHEADDKVRLALALTVRALRSGSVCIDLHTVRSTAFDETAFDETAFDETGAAIDFVALPWPDPEEWIAAIQASPL